MNNNKKVFSYVQAQRKYLFAIIRMAHFQLVLLFMPKGTMVLKVGLHHAQLSCLYW